MKACLAGDASPAAGGAPSASLDVPDWALGILSVRKLSGALDKAGLYANNLLPNSSELAKQIILTFMFRLPLGGGVQNGAALIVIPDPVSTGTKDEVAFILPATDKDALKKVFIDTYGVPTEADGVMTFTLPQPLPQPDKSLLVRFAGDRLLAAPNPVVLKKLSEFVEGRTDAALAGTANADAVLAINVATVKRAYGVMVAAVLGVVEQLAGVQRREEVQALSELVEMLWQVNSFEARLELNDTGTSGTIELAAFPRGGTPLAARVAAPAKSVSSDVIRLVPSKAALFGSWNINGPAMAEMLRAKLPKPSGPQAKQAEELESAILGMLETIDGDAAVSLSLVNDSSLGVLKSFRSSDAAKAGARIKTALEKFAALINADLQAGAAAEPWKKNVQVRVKNADAGEHAGVKIEGVQIDAAGLPPEATGTIQRILGWPLTVRYAAVGTRMLLASGPDGLEALKQAIDREKQTAPLSDTAEAMKNAAQTNPHFLGSFTATQLARLIFGIVPLQPKINPDRLTRGLSDTPITLTGRAEKAYSLLGEVPVTAADAVGTIGQRLEGVNLRIDQAALQGGGDAPAPPPPAK